ncbi:MAG: hypothetical protein R3E39_28060 [Anaerolineae bacterium]
MNISERTIISIELTADERRRIEEIAHNLGYDQLGNYVRHLLGMDDEGEAVNPEDGFREGWQDMVAGRVYPASSLWDDDDDE